MFALGLRTSLRSAGLHTRPVRAGALRHSSSSSASASAAAANSAAGATPSALSWVQFFQLKKQNSRINLVSSSATAVLGSFLTLTALGNTEVDVEKPIMGLDPMMMLGGLVCLGGFAGFVVGPFLGTALFNVRNKALLAQFKSKDKAFFKHIQRKRVDPTSQSFSNPVPDYYGEKIYSLKDYKQWLRDCNAFRRKAKEFL